MNVNPETKKEIKEGLRRRVLPLFASLALVMVILGPNLDWDAFSVGLMLALAGGLILALIYRTRIRAAGLTHADEQAGPIKVTLEVRPVALLLWVAASVAIGFLVGVVESRAGCDLGDYGIAIGVPLLLFGLGLSLQPRAQR